MFYYVVMSAKCLITFLVCTIGTKKGALLCLLNVMLDENKIVPSYQRSIIYVVFDFFFFFLKN
jgi:hypothetical protein